MHDRTIMSGPMHARCQWCGDDHGDDWVCTDHARGTTVHVQSGTETCTLTLPTTDMQPVYSFHLQAHQHAASLFGYTNTCTMAATLTTL